MPDTEKQILVRSSDYFYLELDPFGNKSDISKRYMVPSYAIFEYKEYKVQVFCGHDAAWYAVLWHGSYFLTIGTKRGLWQSDQVVGC